MLKILSTFNFQDSLESKLGSKTESKTDLPLALHTQAPRRHTPATKFSILCLMAACWATAGTSVIAKSQESSTAATAGATTGANAGAGEVIRCKSQSGQEVREIRTKSLEAGKKVPCEVVYKKADGEKVIYSAQAQEGYCEMKATEFSEKLTGLGFDCGL